MSYYQLPQSSYNAADSSEQNPYYYSNDTQPTSISYGFTQQSAPSSMTRSPSISTFSNSSQISNRANKDQSSPTLLHCLHPGCAHVSKRQYDLNRHISKKHGLATELSDCPRKNCHRVGENGFKREDHLTEHLRKFHKKDIPKTGSGSKSGR